MKRLTQIFIWKSQQPKPLRGLARDLARIVGNLFSQITKWDPQPLGVEDEETLNREDYSDVGFFIHVFYEDYIADIRRLMLQYGPTAKFHFTASSERLLRSLNQAAEESGLEVSSRLVPNRGRNFGPLLVEYGKEMQKFTYAIHLHSKRSPQYKKSRAQDWAQDSWNLFGLQGDKFRLMLRILDRDPEIGLAVAVNLRVTPPSSFGWGMNARLGAELSKRLGVRVDAKKFVYPAGGMFLCRPSAINQLLEETFSYSEFPEEKGDYDGNLEHAIERMIGVLPKANQNTVLLFASGKSIFTFDQRFLGRNTD